MQYSSRPPGASSVTAVASASRSWVAAKVAMSAARRSSRMSGWRRMTPVAEHGASSRMRSNGRPSQKLCGSRASADDEARGALQGAAGSRAQRRARAGSMSSAVTSAPLAEKLEQVAGLAARCRAGIQDAHARRRIEQPAASCAPASWTETRPSAKSGRSLNAYRVSQSQRRWLPTVALRFNPALLPAARKVGVRGPMRDRSTRSVIGGWALLASARSAACRPRGADALGEPGGMRGASREACIDRRCEERGALAHEPAQHGIDEPGARGAPGARRIDRRMHASLRGVARVLDLVRGDNQQRAQTARRPGRRARAAARPRAAGAGTSAACPGRWHARRRARLVPGALRERRRRPIAAHDDGVDDPRGAASAGAPGAQRVLAKPAGPKRQPWEKSRTRTGRRPGRWSSVTASAPDRT